MDLHARRRALEARLRASSHESASHRSELHAALAEILKDLGYNHNYGPGLAEAVYHARQATALAPSEPLLWLLRGRREPEAEVRIVCFTEAIRLSGGSADAYKERGYAFDVLHCHEAALDDFRRSDERAAGYGSPSAEVERLTRLLASPESRGRPGRADALAAELVARVTLPTATPPAAGGSWVVVALVLLIVGAGLLGMWAGSP